MNSWLLSNLEEKRLKTMRSQWAIDNSNQIIRFNVFQSYVIFFQMFWFDDHRRQRRK
jgi:hypothetical protein